MQACAFGIMGGGEGSVDLRLNIPLAEKILEG